MCKSRESGSQELALDAVNTVAVDGAGGGAREIDIKKYIKIEKIPGGSVEDCRVLKGVMFNKASNDKYSMQLLPAALVFVIVRCQQSRQQSGAGTDILCAAAAV